MTRFLAARWPTRVSRRGRNVVQGFLAHRRQPKLLFYRCLVREKNPSANAAIFSIFPACGLLLLRGNQRRASGSTVLANSAHCPAALGQNLRTQPDFGNHSLIWQSL